MKKLLLLSMFFSVLLSCSSDGDIIPDDTSGNISGGWILKAEYHEMVRQPLSECRLNENLFFEGTKIATTKAEEISESNCNLTAAEGTFLRSDNNLTITLPNESLTFKIKELTKVKLVLNVESSGKSFEYERIP